VKKLISLGIAVAVIIALVTTGTLAKFSDTETAEDNEFTAGTLNLQVGTADPCTESFDIGGTSPGMSPGANGNAGTWLTKNTGSIAGDLSIKIGTVENYENADQSADCTDPEDDAGDTSCTAGSDQGELGGLVKVAFWMDVDKSGGWSSGDYYLPEGGGSEVSYASGTTLPTAAYDILDDYDSDSWVDVQTSIAGGTDIGNFRIEYNWPTDGSSDNKAQTDYCVFDITFDLEQ